MRLPYIITDKTDSPLMAEGLSYIYNYYHWQKINVHTSIYIIQVMYAFFSLM